ncbi:MAG: cbb3-type cytochrome oxidase assembly protein CcoS [Saprospiraceae bacterium]
MKIILLLIIISLAVALLFLGAFFWAVRSGQYDDSYTPAMRILPDDEIVEKVITSGIIDSQITPN